MCVFVCEYVRECMHASVTIEASQPADVIPQGTSHCQSLSHLKVCFPGRGGNIPIELELIEQPNDLSVQSQIQH